MWRFQGQIMALPGSFQDQMKTSHQCKNARRFAMRIFTAIVFSIIMLGAAKADEPFTNADLLRSFDAIGFGNEYTGRRYDVVRKWIQPLNIGIQGNKHPAYLETYIEEIAKDLTETTGHNVRLYFSERLRRADNLPENFDVKEVNVFILYLSEEEIGPALNQYFNVPDVQREAMRIGATCMATFGTRKNEIRNAIIIVPARHPESFHHDCITEEIAQIMGLPNDSPDAEWSIFNDNNSMSGLTEHDRWLLRALYLPDITPGMHRHDALRKALAFWKRARRG